MRDSEKMVKYIKNIMKKWLILAFLEPLNIIL